MPSAAAVDRHCQQYSCVTPEHSAIKIFAPTSDDSPTKDRGRRHGFESGGTSEQKNVSLDQSGHG